MVSLLTGCSKKAETAAAGSAGTGTSGIPNFNPTGYPIVNEKITLRVAFNANPELPSDLNTQALSIKTEEATNIHIDWIQIPGAGWTERKNLMLATGDLPDLFEAQLNADDLTRYGPDGTFIPMQDLIEKYAPNFTRLYEEMPALDAYITAPDGNKYGVARINAGPWMPVNGQGMINKMWLDKLGLAVPKTIDEFYEVLKAFKTRDPNGNGKADEIPLTFSTAGSSTITHIGGLSWLVSSFGLGIGGNNFNEVYAGVVDGKVINMAARPEFKEAIAYISKLYQEGLVDVEGFTLTGAEVTAKLNAEPGIIGYTQIWDKNDSVSNPTNNKALVYMPALTGPGGRTPVIYRNPMPGTFRGWGVITKACKYPEAAMRWIDYHYDLTNSIELIEGPIGVRVLENPDGTLYVRTPPDGLSVGQDRFANCRAGGLFGMTVNVYRTRLKLPSTDEKVQFLDGFLDQLSEKTPMMPVYYTGEESTEMAQLQTDMLQYIERRACEWIMNGKVEAEWDAYLAEMERVGQKRWLEIKQVAYDRYMAALQ
jgi:putative aldouronate transport system substrate-binding protein